MRISALEDVSGDQNVRFRDRSDAGQRLGKALEPYRAENPVVLGLARGGVVLAAWVAKQLDAPLDVLICLKVGAPNHPEFAIGAVAPNGIRVFDPNLLSRLHIPQEKFEQMARERMDEVNRRLTAYRGDKPALDLTGRTAIVVDDGLATGTTALAAVRYAHALGVSKVVLAAPVCSNAATDLLADETDELICLSEPSFFYSVGQWYDDFSQVEDREVLRLLQTAGKSSTPESVTIDVGSSVVRGDLMLGGPGTGVVVFAHGSGSGRLSPRNQFVASELNKAGHGTLLVDLLTEEEEQIDRQTRHLRFDIPFLTDRLATATEWLLARYDVPLAFFGASTGAAAAIGAGVRFKSRTKAVVSRGGRPDMASSQLPLCDAPALFIVGERDPQVIQLNELALAQLGSKIKELRIVPGATHLFEEAGALEEVARLSREWFDEYL